MPKNAQLERLRRSVDLDPTSRLVAPYAEALRKSGELTEAMRVARAGLSQDSTLYSARITLGRALLDSGDCAGARRELEAVLRDVPGNVLAGHLLGQCLEELGEQDSALLHYRRVLALEPSDEEVQRRICLLEQSPGTHAPTPARELGSERAPGAEVTKPSAVALPPATIGFARSSGPSAAPTDGSSSREVVSRLGKPDATNKLIDYVDFSDEGIVTPTKASPMIESLSDPNSVVGEALRFLGSKVQDIRRNRGVRCLALTSALPGEGKSTLTLSLACAMAREADQRILIVEADLRRPSITRTLGLPPAPGLSEWLQDQIDYVPVRAVEPGGFFLLAAGQAGLERPELLGSPRMDALLRASREFFDFVLVDAIPVLPATDTVLLQNLVDGFLLVVRSRKTPREAIRDALARLRPDKVKGVVLNDHHEYRDSYRAYSYRRYGMTAERKGRRGRRSEPR